MFKLPLSELELPSFSSYVSLDIALAVGGAYLVYRIAQRSRRYPYPPGPKGHPIFGSISAMPSDNDPEVLAKWADQYGDLVHLSGFGDHTVIINSHDIAVDLLERRGLIYSDRPRFVVAGEYVGFDNTLSLSMYSDQFREHRRLFHETMGSPQKARRWANLEEREIVKFLAMTTENPDKWRDNLYLTSARIILSVAYDYSPETMSDEIVRYSDDVIILFSALSAPGAFIVDKVPFLQHLPSWLPGARWKKHLPEWRKMAREFAEVPLNMVKKRIDSGEVVECFVADKLRDKSLSANLKRILSYAAGSMYSAGADTTYSTVLWFFLYMLQNPEVLKCAQAEVDSVLGQSRLPTFEDRQSLPYVYAVVKEVMRLGTVGPTGFPHRLKQDDVYNGYYFKKGTHFVANIWLMLRDPGVYHEPSKFNPERFLGPHPEKDPETVFGFGRRICPGRYLAEVSVYLLIAQSLAFFDILPAYNSDGSQVEFETTVEGGTSVKRPSPFPCVLKPRSPELLALVERTAV